MYHSLIELKVEENPTPWNIPQKKSVSAQEPRKGVTEVLLVKEEDFAARIALHLVPESRQYHQSEDSEPFQWASQAWTSKYGRVKGSSISVECWRIVFVEPKHPGAEGRMGRTKNAIQTILSMDWHNY